MRIKNENDWHYLFSYFVLMNENEVCRATKFENEEWEFYSPMEIWEFHFS